MRFDKTAYLVKTSSTYDPTTGDYVDGDPVKTAIATSIMDTGREAQKLVYGDIHTGRLTMAVQGNITQAFDHIEVDSRRYKVDQTRHLRHKTTYLLTEMP